MTTTRQTLEREIAGTEKAIRLLIGESAALNSKLKRLEATLKLERARLRALSPVPVKLPPGMRFPDVSSFQSNVDWRAVHNASSLHIGSFAVTKITEGAAWVDPYGTLRWRHMAANGMRRGGYHFAHPSVPASTQAQHFLNHLFANNTTVTPTDVVVFDLEVSDGQSGRIVAACAKAWAAEVRKHVPCKLWLYGGGPFLRDNGVSLDGYDAHWLAAYVSNPAPYMIYGRSRTVAWQYTDGKFGPAPHVCPGIGAGDLSIVL